MSLEFAVQHPCTLRARYSEKHLRDWGRLSSIHAAITTGDNSAPTEDKIGWVSSAAAEIDRLQTESAVCSDSPAFLPAEIARQGEALGCLGESTIRPMVSLKSLSRIVCNLFWTRWI